MNVLRRAPTRTPKAGSPSSQYVTRTFDWGSLLMLRSVRRTRGMAQLTRVKLGTQIAEMKGSGVVRSV
jgi:hypothetical protein